MIELIVYGTPAPQGSKSFKGIVNGHAVMAESSKKVKPWRREVKAAAEAYLRRPGAAPIPGAVIAAMVFTMPKPKSAPKTRVTYPSVTPDVSKLLRSTEDALTDAGIWEDDARVIRYTELSKVYPGEGRGSLDRPGVRIWIKAVDQQQAALL